MDQVCGKFRGLLNLATDPARVAPDVQRRWKLADGDAELPVLHLDRSYPIFRVRKGGHAVFSARELIQGHTPNPRGSSLLKWDCVGAEEDSVCVP